MLSDGMKPYPLLGLWLVYEPRTPLGPDVKVDGGIPVDKADGMIVV